MKITEEVTGYIKNIEYYSEKIRELAISQLDNDMKFGEKYGMNSYHGGIRIDALAKVDGAAEMIKIYCQNIRVNINTAQEQDKLLNTEEEENESSVNQEETKEG